MQIGQVRRSGSMLFRRTGVVKRIKSGWEGASDWILGVSPVILRGVLGQG
jgi:hypothetical protein